MYQALKDELLEAADAFANLDCLLAMAAFANENNHVRPRLVAGKGIAIAKGRHPLQELIEQTYQTTAPTSTLLNRVH